MKTVISLFDIHYPYNINLDPVYKFIRDNRPDEIILGWDMIDCEWVSKFFKWNPEEWLVKTIQEIRWFEKILKELVRNKAKIIYMLWNHEYRIYEAINNTPLLNEVINIKKEYKDYIDEWVDYNKYYKVWPLYYIHWTYHNDAFAKKHALMYQKNIRMWHLHKIQEYSMATPINEKAISSKWIPCLCELNPDYMKNKPSAWDNGFNIAYIDWDNYNDYTIVINDWWFIYNWKKY